MLRLYLSTETRLHVWDTRFAVPDVSTIHNHPWSFESYIVAGAIKQRRYIVSPDGKPFNVSTILAGPGGGLRTAPQPVKLEAQDLEVYGEGDSYTQTTDEIHWSMPEDGTVTLVTRRFVKADRDHARVFWPAGADWVSAEPRPATSREIHEIMSRALERWFPINEQHSTSSVAEGAPPP
jgi:hypothetical protein